MLHSAFSSGYGFVLKLMAEQPKTLMRRYLLNQLPEEERSEFEDRLFNNHDLFERLVEVENEIIDSYASGRLSQMERQRLEVQFLNAPQRQQRVAFARTLDAYFHPQNTVPVPAPQN